jgi:peptide/nickel transport system ATP-binding protein
VTAAVEVDGLVVADPAGRRVLDGAGLRIDAGQVVALVGPSGAGKTTLLRAVTGGLPSGLRREAGTVHVLGRSLTEASAAEVRELRRRYVAFVGQDPGSRLNPRMRVRQLVGELAVETSLTAVLAEVHLPADLLGRRPGELSGGQQRRVAVARALARRPRVLLLDEPTAGLDTALRDAMAVLLRDLARRRGLAIALCCHDLDLVERVADRVVSLRPRSRARCPAPRRPVPVPGPDVLTARVSAHVRSGPVLTDVGLAVARGGAVAVVGPSGAGKTTLARALVGLHRRTAGSLVLGGTPLPLALGRRTRDQRRRIQLVPQDPLGALNPSRTVGATLARPLRLHRRRGDVVDLLGQVGLPASFTGRYPHELSGGQRQRVSIARALAAEPDVLLCDEVTSALDPGTAASVMDLLAALRAERGLGLVVISHDLRLVAAYTDTVVVLEEGRVVRTGPSAALPAAAE